jgi:serralysin
MPTTTLVTNSGSADIDGVLSGIKWGTTALTFSFPTAASQYGYTGEIATFGIFSAAAQTAVTNQILTQYAAISGLTFNIVTETATVHGDLRYADSDLPETAWAYYPSTGEWGGDVWAHKSPDVGLYLGISTAYDTPVRGNYAFHTFLHETGHALGLKHGQDAGIDFGTFFGALPTAHDSMEYSVMTYKSYVGGSASTGYSNGQFDFAQTLMQDDVAAIQYMYGANFTTNSGNSIYTWSLTGEEFVNGVGQGAPGGTTIFMNVWDGGGIDTYDFSARTTNISVDLRPGGWVNLGTQLADLGDLHTAIGNISNSLLFQGNVASLIENANGGTGNDNLIGNQADNVLNGNNGDDTLRGGAGNDALNGGAGVDTADWSDATSKVVVVLSSTGGDAVTVAGLGTDTLTSIENLTGGSADDILNGNQLVNILTGGAGNDILVGNAGNDTYYGGDGGDTISELTVSTLDNDTIYGGNGVDIIYANFGDDLVYGGTDTANNYISLGDGADQAFGSEGTDVVLGGNGDDIITGNGGSDSLYGEAGNDTIYGGAGVDLLSGDVGDDKLYGGTENDKLVGDAGNDILDGGDGVDELIGGAGADTEYGGLGNDYVEGGDGVDTMYGGDGNDTMLGDLETVAGGDDIMFGDAGDDIMLGYIGNDTMNGGDGNDRLYGVYDNDTIDGGAGNDDVYGGAGNDILTGGAGIDQLFGGAGNDDFRWAATGFNVENIWDFTGGLGASDRLVFATSLFANEADVRAHAVFSSGNTTITATDGGTIVLVGVNIANLVSDDFTFF